MLTYVLLLIIGISGIILSARLFEWGGSKLGKRFGLSAFIVGSFIAAPGTSSPEFFISLLSSLKGNTGVAVGSVMGSNLFNPVIIGITCIVFPFSIQKKSVSNQSLIMVLFTLIFTSLLFFTGGINLFGGIILIFALLIYMYKTFKNTDSNEDCDFKIKEKSSYYKIILYIVGIIISITGLYFSGNITVDNAILIAKTLDISETIIAKTVLAIGTSLPELAICIVYAWKKEYNTVMSNILMSNILNLTFVIGSVAIISSLINKTIYFKPNPIDLGSVIFFALIVTIFSLTFKIGKLQVTGHFNRFRGVFIIGAYIIYTFVSILKIG